MPCNFPLILDTNLTLGGPFVNDVPVTDPTRQIDADLRSNTVDAALAIESRVGVTNSAIVTSLSWATMSIGGVDNLGLRFAGNSAAWPGAVGEDGIFLEITSGYPNFHRSGDALNVFYPLTGAAGVINLQNAYSGGNVITTAAAADIAFIFTATEDFTIDHPPNSQTIMSGAAHTATNGMLNINYTAIAATGAMAVLTTSQNAINNQEVGGFYTLMDNDGDLANTELVYCYGAELDMSGDGPVAPGLALGAAFYATTAAFTGVNEYKSVGLLVDSSFDWGLRSNAPIKVTAPARAVEIDSDPAAVDSAVLVANVGTNASALFQGYEGTVATIGAGAIARFAVGVDGSTLILCDNAGTAFYVSQVGAGSLCQLRDITAAVTRVEVTKLGETTIEVDAAAAGGNATLIHNNADGSFLVLAGTFAGGPIPPVFPHGCNMTDENGFAPVDGPTADVWNFAGMVMVETLVGGGGFGPGHYWMPLYSHA